MLVWFGPLLQGAAQTQAGAGGVTAAVGTAAGVGAAAATGRATIARAGTAAGVGAASATGATTGGTIRYISPSGNDTTGTGAIGAPYRKISKAVSVSAAGDTVLCRGGTYTYSGGTTGRDNVTGSGSSGARIKIENYPGEVPIFDGNGLTNFDSSQNGSLIYVTGSWLHFKGLEFTRAPTAGIMIEGGSNNIIENCKGYRNGFGSAFEGWGFAIWGASGNNLLLNCDGYFNRDTAGTGGNGDGFYTRPTSTGNILRNCRAYRNSDDGFDAYMTVSGTQAPVTFENCWAYENGYAEDGTTRLGDGNGFKMGGSSGTAVNGRHVYKQCFSFRNAANG